MVSTVVIPTWTYRTTIHFIRSVSFCLWKHTLDFSCSFQVWVSFTFILPPTVPDPSSPPPLFNRPTMFVRQYSTHTRLIDYMLYWYRLLWRNIWTLNDFHIWNSQECKIFSLIHSTNYVINWTHTISKTLHIA